MQWINSTFERAHAAQTRQELGAREYIAFIDNGCHTIAKDVVARVSKSNEFRSPQGEFVSFSLVDEVGSFIRGLYARRISRMSP